jgi:hypothetical protein
MMTKVQQQVVDVPLDSIRIDGGTQPRAHINQDAVDEYAADDAAGQEFPAGEAVHDGAEYWLWDGFHRYFARKKNGRETMALHVREGTQADARWLSLAANKTHGIRRTNEDKRKATAEALTQKPELSNNLIAEHVGVSDMLVADVRKSLQDSCSQPASRVGKDGRTTNTANIGKPSANGHAESVRCDDCTRKNCRNNPKCKGCERARAAAKAAAKNGAAVPGTEDEDAPHGDDWEPGPGDDPAPVDLEAEAPAQPEPTARQEAPASTVQATKKAEQAIGALSRALDELKVFGKHQRCLQAIKDNVLALSRGEG